MEWKNIKGFENKYQVSINGDVRSINFNNTNEIRILKPKINKQGYLEVTLNKHNKHHYKLVSRLVYETFTNIMLTKNDIIMYRDKDKTNCSFNNLYIITRGKRQEITYDSNRRYKPLHEFYGEMLSTKEISKISGIKPHNIRDRIRTRRWSIEEASETPVGIYRRKK